MKKKFALLIAGLMTLSLVACANNATTASEAGEGKLTVGVCQLVQHPALDAATEGFKEVVERELGDSVNVIVQNASGEQTNCSTIINSFISRGVNLIMTNATPPLQTAAAATKDIPILGTSVTDYASALEVDNFTGVIGGNVSGTSDLAPLDEQAKMVKEWCPDAKTCGIIYCNSEANSEYQVREMTKYLKNLGIEAKPYSFTDSNDVAQVTKVACDNSDCLYVPTDNVAASNAEAIANVIIPENKICIAGESGICKGCGVATLSIDYHDLGMKTGEMAVSILRDGADISTMKIEYAPEVKKYYNKMMIEKLGLTVLDGYEEIE